MKKLILIFIMLFSFGAFAAENQKDVTSYLVGDGEGNIYWEENMHEIHPLASVTKVMTMIVTFDEIRKGKVKLDDDVVITLRAAEKGGSMIPVKVGQVYKLSDILKAVGIHSANNAAYALAEHVGGTYENFIKMMNDKAKVIGVGDEVTFYTPAGLPPDMTREKMDVGSAYAMYKIMLEAMKYPEYLEIAGMKTAEIDNGKILLRSKNNLLGKEGIKGLKTGYNGSESGFNILAYNDKNGIRNYYVVFGGKTAKIRDNKVLELDKQFHEEYKQKEILNPEKVVGEVPVEKGKVKSVKLYPDKSVAVIARENDNVKIDIDAPKKLTAPLAKETTYGTYKVLKNGKEVASGNLVVAEPVEKKSILDTIKEMF